MKSNLRMMTACVLCLAAASLLTGCATTPAVTNPCDVLVAQNPKPETNTFIVQNDRPFAEAVAKHRGRYQRYRCGE